MKFAKWVFTIAGVYGLIAVTPQYFLENMAGGGAPLAQPAFFYGFLGVALAFQFVFLIIGRDPAKHRLLMLPSIVEKVSFPASAWPLFLAGRADTQIAAFSAIDGVIAVLFVIAWLRTRPGTV